MTELTKYFDLFNFSKSIAKSLISVNDMNFSYFINIIIKKKTKTKQISNSQRSKTNQTPKENDGQ